MCGLVGLAGDLAHKDEGTLKRLLIFDTLRGLDSTGVAVVRNTGAVNIAKAASHPFDLFETKRFTSAVDGYNSKVFIGHNRAATTGAKTTLNAHPFQYGSITGAHNGTLERACWKNLEKELGEEFDVDSQALFAAIDEFGIEDTITMIEEGRTSSTGAWALTWYDSTDDTLNFLRNKHRPLWLSYEEGFKKIIWASEWPMIFSATEMSNVEYKLYTDDSGYKFFSLPADMWYRVKMEDLLLGNTEVPLELVKPIKGKEPTTAVYTNTGFRPPFLPSTQAKKTGTSHTKASLKNTSVFTIPVDKDDPFKSILTADEIAYLSTHGCAWCHGPVSGKEDGSTLIEPYHSIVCPDCTGHTGGINKAYVSDDLFETIYEAK